MAPRLSPPAASPLPRTTHLQRMNPERNTRFTYSTFLKPTPIRNKPLTLYRKNKHQVRRHSGEEINLDTCAEPLPATETAKRKKKLLDLDLESLTFQHQQATRTQGTDTTARRRSRRAAKAGPHSGTPLRNGFYFVHEGYYTSLSRPSRPLRGSEVHVA